MERLILDSLKNKPLSVYQFGFQKNDCINQLFQLFIAYKNVFDADPTLETWSDDIKAFRQRLAPRTNIKALDGWGLRLSVKY